MTEPIVFTETQLRQIWAKICDIQAHFDSCCAFMQDSCHQGNEYDDLYKVLILAGAPEVKTPFSPEDFEEWMASR